jgi:hypothetical protein
MLFRKWRVSRWSKKSVENYMEEMRKEGWNSIAHKVAVAKTKEYK